MSVNDDPRNVLALTPDAHWMFDAGLWTAIPKGDHFLIEVAEHKYKESSTRGFRLRGDAGQILIFHENSRLRPHQEHLAWHKREKFLG